MIVDKSADILLVEDSAGDAELCVAAIKSRNPECKVVHLADGDQVLDFICASSLSANWRVENAPRVILLDLKLTTVGGMEVLKQLKSEERTRPIPLVVFTGSGSEAEIIECYRLGVNSYVVKPGTAKQYSQLVGEIAHYWLKINHSLR